MRLLLLGGTGRLGSEFVAAADRRHHALRATYYTRPRPDHVPLDVRDTDAVTELFDDYEPDAVVWTAPPIPDAVARLARHAARTAIPVAFVSGDGVFGDCKTARREDDPVAPAGAVAAAQAACEAALREHHPDSHLIARTAFVYGGRAKGDPLGRVLRALSKGETVLADDAAVRMPTFAADLADAVLALLYRGLTGTYHLLGPDRHTEFSFARTAAMICGFDADLVQPRPAFDEQPGRIVLDRFKATAALGRTAFRSLGDAVRLIRDRQRAAQPVLARAA
jgi:dTDP-4-dehydrorhamnose reductase